MWPIEDYVGYCQFIIMVGKISFALLGISFEGLYPCRIEYSIATAIRLRSRGLLGATVALAFYLFIIDSSNQIKLSQTQI